MDVYIHIDTLVQLLKDSNLPQLGVPPDEYLIITFSPEGRTSDHSETFDRIDTGCVNVDVDDKGLVTHIEFDNIPLECDYRNSIQPILDGK